jgi:hypothetical protein
MVDRAEFVRIAARALVQRLGCLDAAAATISARFGGATSKGTLSKKMSGALDFTVQDVIALEDAVGSFPITEALVRRLSKETIVRGCLFEEGAALAKEAGEAISAMMTAANTASVGDRARAVAELAEAGAKIDACIALLEQGK